MCRPFFVCRARLLGKRICSISSKRRLVHLYIDGVLESAESGLLGADLGNLFQQARNCQLGVGTNLKATILFDFGHRVRNADAVGDGFEHREVVHRVTDGKDLRGLHTVCIEQHVDAAEFRAALQRDVHPFVAAGTELEMLRQLARKVLCELASP